MPHLLIDRVRTNPLTLLHITTVPSVLKRRSLVAAVIVESMDILGGLIFIAGSIAFLPSYSHEMQIFLYGCMLFVAGAIVYVLISAYTTWEAIHYSGFGSMETFENTLYFAGSLVFLAGTVLYWPDKAHTYGIQYLKSMSLGVYFNLFNPVFEGTVLFIIGSCMFAIAAFVNGLNLHEVEGDKLSRQLLIITTSSYMLGSILFVIGSVAFLPSLGGAEMLEAFGAWCFIVGSVLYLLGSSVSLGRTIRYSRSQAGSGSETAVQALVASRDK